MTSEKSDPGKPPPRWALKTMTRLHVALHRLSGGRRFNTLAGDDVCFVTMTGAKSGRQVTIPLMYVPHGEGVLLVASQGGAPKHPVWYYNLKADPDVEIRDETEVFPVRAREVPEGDERQRLWDIAVAAYPPYQEYQEKTTRLIPVFITEPR